MRGSREEYVRMVIDRDRWMAEAIRSESRAAGRRPALQKHAEKGRNAGALFRIVGKRGYWHVLGRLNLNRRWALWGLDPFHLGGMKSPPGLEPPSDQRRVSEPDKLKGPAKNNRKTAGGDRWEQTHQARGEEMLDLAVFQL
ncbi:hypothetical protein SRHO_G00190290 [Serrasalmus rhombeus]